MSMKNLRSLLGGSLDSFDIGLTSRLMAALDTAAYYNSHARKMQAFETKQDLHRFGLSLTPDEGLILEFGVATGQTINFIADTMPDRTVYGFDVFTGLPEIWRTGFGSGAFSQGGKLPDVSENVELVVGLFEDTLPGWLETHEGTIAYLHVDSDLYSAASTIFTQAGGRLGPGSVIAFDEYWNFPGWQQDGFKAFHEFLKATGMRYSYEGFVPTHQQVLVRLL